MSVVRVLILLGWSLLLSCPNLGCSNLVSGTDEGNSGSEEDDEGEEDVAPPASQECTLGSFECECFAGTCFGGLSCDEGMCAQASAASDVATPEETEDCAGLDGATYLRGPDTGVCYRYSGESETWFDASLECEAWGGRLATIHSQEQQEEVRAFLEVAVDPTNTDSVWLGHHSNGELWRWEWVSGSEFSFTSWGVTEPDQETEGSCGYAYLRSDWNWHDQDCSLPYTFLCER